MDVKTAITESGKQLGYDKLRAKQIEAMTAFVQGNDVFVSLPTGYGKSIIYAALPYVFDKLRGKLQSYSDDRLAGLFKCTLYTIIIDRYIWEYCCVYQSTYISHDGSTCQVYSQRIEN